MKKSIFAAFLIVFGFSLFAEVTVVNPAPGSYANLQTLVIEAGEGEEIYYSFSGSDPLSQGFAYDGPVVLDVTGNVDLRVASIDRERQKSETQVSFFVEPSEPENEEKKAFLKSFETGPCFDLQAGSKISVPFSMSYSFFQAKKFEKGRELSVSKKATMERYVPINLSDGTKVWRYVIHAFSGESGALSRQEVPFKIDGWSKVVLTDPKRIYSLDGAWWQGAGKAVSLDRSVMNEILFQSADYSPENPVTKISLPKKPSLSLRRQSDGSVKISIAPETENAQKFSLSSSTLAKKKLLSQGLYSELYLDAFPGEKLEALFPIDIYYDKVFQGTLYAEAVINRLAPDFPIIKSSASSSYSRDDVLVSATCGPKLKLYCSVSDPVEVKPDAPKLNGLKFPKAQYNLYGGQKIALFGDTEKVLAYKVSFYSEDEAGVKSETAEYSVIIDKYNYYVDPDSNAAQADGSPFAPFKDLSRVAKIIRSKPFSRFFIKGSVSFPAGEISVVNNVEFCGLGDARARLPANCAILMKNAGLFAQNIIWEKDAAPSLSKKPRAASPSMTNFFILESSAATFKNCEVIARFSGDGKAFNCSSSSLRLESTGVTADAEGYACAVNASGSSKISVESSRVLSVGDTAVVFSSTGGTWLLQKNFAQVSGRMGRPAEFIDSTVTMTENQFFSDVQNRGSEFKPVYTSGKTQFLEDKGNVYK